MTTRPEPARLDTVRGTTRQIIGLTRNLGKKAVEDIDLQQKEAVVVLESVRVLIASYESLLAVCSDNGMVGQVLAPEQEDYRAAKHYLRILDGLYGPKAANS